MSEQSPLPAPEAPQPAQPDFQGEHHHTSNTGRWIPGIILIVLGLVFLVNNLTGVELRNWWALFILIPAFSAFGNAYETYRRTGTLNNSARSSLFGGTLLTCVAAVFLFNLSWSIFGPVVLILLGGTMLVNALLPK